MMQHCIECGAELPNNAVFCGRCGRKTTSEDEIDTRVSSDPIEDISESQSSIEMTLSDSQDSNSNNEEDEQLQIPGLPSENKVEEEEQTPNVISEHEYEGQAPTSASEVQQEQHSPYPTSDYENEEQIHHDDVEPAESMPYEADSEPEIVANQFRDEQPQNAQTLMATLEAQRSNSSAQKSRSRSVSRCLLFSFAGLIVLVGVVVVLMGLVHLHTLGFGGSSDAQFNSSEYVIINPNGSSITASICVKTSTPSTNPGATFVLTSSSGCSTVTASKADSSCLIFPNTSGASRKYIFDVSNTSIDSKSYHLVLGIVNYTGATTYNDANHVSIGLSEGSTGRNFSWLYHSGSIIVNNDEQTGTMDVILEAVNGGNTIHIVGEWACGTQLKNT